MVFKTAIQWSNCKTVSKLKTKKLLAKYDASCREQWYIFSSISHQ